MNITHRIHINPQNMETNDFDSLLVGASPEEIRRLHKLLREWSDGDENGFPVQLALITRAQWRSAAAIPKLVSHTCAEIQKCSLEAEKRIDAALQRSDQEWSKKWMQLQRALEHNQKNTELKVGELNHWVTDARKVAVKWSQEFESGAGAWKEAKDSFTQSAKTLNQATADMESRPWRSHWVMMILLILAAGVVGSLAAKLGYF